MADYEMLSPFAPLNAYSGLIEDGLDWLSACIILNTFATKLSNSSKEFQDLYGDKRKKTSANQKGLTRAN